ncbi:MAG TPA: c-type cytochrome [Gemmatimonadaceae bacterium]
MKFRHTLSECLPMFALAIAAAVAASCGGNAREQRTSKNVARVATPVTSMTAQWPAPPAVRHDDHMFAGGIAPPGATMHNPFDGDAKEATLGGQFFTSMNCDGCHGGGATGWVGPSLSARRWRYGGADGAVYQSIYYGRPRGMPAFGGILPPDDIWRIVTYLRSLPLPVDVPTESWP